MGSCILSTATCADQQEAAVSSMDDRSQIPNAIGAPSVWLQLEKKIAGSTVRELSQYPAARASERKKDPLPADSAARRLKPQKTIKNQEPDRHWISPKPKLINMRSTETPYRSTFGKDSIRPKKWATARTLFFQKTPEAQAGNRGERTGAAAQLELLQCGSEHVAHPEGVSVLRVSRLGTVKTTLWTHLRRGKKSVP